MVNLTLQILSFFNANRAPCQICGKTSHQALDCYHRMDFSFQGRHPPSQLAAMTAHAHAVPENEQPWYLDSGANNHVTAELENLSLQQPYQGSDSVTVGNGGGLQIANTGSTLISTPKTLLHLHNILHCPNASSNLLSIQKFCKDNNCYFILTSTYFVIKDLWTKEILLQGPSEDGLYPIYLKQLQGRKRASKVAFVSSFTAFLGVTAPVHVWHSRLGHPSESIIHKLFQESLLPVSGSVKFNKLCESCQVSKSRKLPFSDSLRRSTHPLELIHSDVWTSPVVSIGGCKFYVVFIDDYSRFAWLFPLKQKSDVLTCFIKFKCLVENLFSYKIKQLQTDNGGEYVSKNFKQFTDSHGILHRLTCPYTSEQNGISERKHRHITETGLTLLAQSKLPPIYWVDAFLTAVYLINRMPTPVLENHSPFFKIFKHHPDYAFLKIFGCACYPLLRPYNSHKLAYRSKQCIFLGYSSNQKGYRCLDPTTNHVYISRHVIFDETSFPAATLSTRPAKDISLGTTSQMSSGIPFLNSNFSGLDNSSSSTFINYVPATPCSSPQSGFDITTMPPAVVESATDFASAESMTETSASAESFEAASASAEPTAAAPTSAENIAEAEDVTALAFAENTAEADGVIAPASVICTTPASAVYTADADHPTAAPLALLPSSQLQMPPQPNPSHTQQHPASSRMITRSQTNSSKPKHFPDYHLYYSTKHPLKALSSITLPLEPKTFNQAVGNPCWLDAMQSEFQALLSNHTWTLCPRPLHKKVVRNKWVFKLKQKPDGSIDRYKARLVAKGFDQEEGIDFNETFSPVIKPATLRLVLALAVQFNWFIHQLDISNAFLHGYLEEEVFMEQPKGFEDTQHPDFVCRLHKSIYGLKQAPRAWFMRLSQALLEIGFTGSLVDTSLFHYHSSSVSVFVLVYVDDIIVTSNSFPAITTLIDQLKNEFAVKDLGALSYFLGIQASRTTTGLHLHQGKYITDLLHRTKMVGAKPASTPCAAGGKLSRLHGDPLLDPREYRHIVGALQYCTLTRPDIAYSVNQLCQFLHNPTSVHLTAAKRVLRYLKGTVDFGLHYTKGSLQLNGFCDSDWAGSPDDRKSTTGYGIYLGPCLISWAAKKQAVVAKSSTEAEYRSMALTVAEMYWLRMLLKELHIVLHVMPCLWVDNIGALSLASNPVYHARTKHIEVDYHFIREKILNKDLVAKYISTYDQPSDVFTKSMTTSRFLLLRNKLMVRPLPINLQGDVSNINSTSAKALQAVNHPAMTSCYEDPLTPIKETLSTLQAVKQSAPIPQPRQQSMPCKETTNVQTARHSQAFQGNTSVRKDSKEFSTATTSTRKHINRKISHIR
jgi:transposase InsO family protein